MAETTNAIEYAIHAKMGRKPWIARVTGSDGTYGYAREFAKAKRDYARSGKTHDASWAITEPGLYQIGDSGELDGWFISFAKDGRLRSCDISAERAARMVEIMDSDEDIAQDGDVAKYERARLATRAPAKTV